MDNLIGIKRLTADQRRLQKFILELDPQELRELEEAAKRWEMRDPSIIPVRLDKFMASAGGSAARYREVTAFHAGIVSYIESPQPFAKSGKHGRMPLVKWQQWTLRASLQHKASVELPIPGVEGYWLHWEILQAIEGIRNEYT